MERLTRELVGFIRLAEALVPVCGQPTSAADTQKQKQIAAALESETELQPKASTRQ